MGQRVQGWVPLLGRSRLAALSVRLGSALQHRPVGCICTCRSTLAHAASTIQATGACPLPAATRTSLTPGLLHATSPPPLSQARLVCVQPSDTVPPTGATTAAAAGPSGGPPLAAPASTASASAPSASPAAASPGPLVGPRCHWYAGSSVLLNSVQVEVTKEDRITLLLPHNQAGAVPCSVRVQQHCCSEAFALLPDLLSDACSNLTAYGSLLPPS